MMLLSLSLMNNTQFRNNFSSNTLVVDNPKISKISPKFHIIGKTGWADFYAEGNCTGAGTSTIPYVIKDLILDAGGSGSGIIIQNSDVYFIIKNSTIWNSGSNFYDGGIRLINVANGTIENNTLFDNTHGVRLENSNNNLITNNTLSDNYYGVLLDNSNNNLITNNTLISSMYGIYFYANCQYNTVSNNVIKNGNRGVESYSSTNSNITINNNSMTSNTYGMDIAGVNHTITDNILKENMYGMRIDDGHDSKIFRNMITDSGSGGVGLYVLDSDNVKIVNNTIKDGGLYALYLIRCDYNELNGNTVSNNSEHGVLIANSGYVLILNNTISFNTGSGLYLNGGVYNQVLNNKIHDNSGTGVRLGSHYNNVSNNVVHNNGIYGIDMGSSSFNNISHNIFKDDAGGPWANEIYVAGTNNSIYANYFINALFSPVRDRGTNNKWNSSSIGNYWSSYTGVDANDDGIGDTPFDIIIGGYDFLPIWWDSPLITINSPNENDVIELSPTFNVSLSRGNVNQSWYTLDNGVTNHTFTGLNGAIDKEKWNEKATGQIILTFFANDSKGYLGSETIQVIKAYEAPQITIHSPTLNKTVGFNAPKFNITVNDLSPINATWYTINGGLINYTFSGLTGTLNQIAWETKGTEIITLRFYANDSLGYVGFKDIDILKDLIAPNIVINSPIQDFTFGSTSPVFNISINDDDLVLTWYTLEGVAGTFSFTGLNGTIDQGEWDSLPQGEISITFYAEDEVGNIGSESVIVLKSIPSQQGISGYNISIIFLGIFLATIITVVKKKKNSKY